LVNLKVTSNVIRAYIVRRVEAGNYAEATQNQLLNAIMVVKGRKTGTRRCQKACLKTFVPTFWNTGRNTGCSKGKRAGSIPYVAFRRS